MSVCNARVWEISEPKSQAGVFHTIERKRVLSTVLTSLSAGALRGECVLYEEFGRDVPRQQLFDPVNRVIGDALENVP